MTILIKLEVLMNKSMKMWMLAAILFCGVGFVGCGNNDDTKQQSKEENKQVVDKKVDAVACDAAVADYLVNVIGKNYAEGELCIPSPFVVSADYGNPEDVKVWGDFWVFNYDLSGDTLKTVSGGNHPGLMHLKKTANGYEVTAFDQVEDGSRYLESAKRIFGDQYSSFQDISGNAEKREDVRRHFVADYVEKHNIAATMIQDYGWPAVELPK